MTQSRAYASGAVACLFALTLSHQTHAASIAAETGVSTISPCPSFCGGGGSISEFDNDGGEDVNFSYSSIPAGVNGNGQAQATVVGGLSLPELKAEAFSNPNARVEANAAGMQKYNYSGPESIFSLDVTLDGEVINGAQALDAALFANAMVFIASDVDFFSHYGTFAFEVLPSSDAVILDEVGINFVSLGLVDAGYQSVTETLEFTLEDGDSLFIWASLVARGTRGGSADAFSTFSFEFTGGNTAGLAAVPLPPALWLFASCLTGLVLKRRAA